MASLARKTLFEDIPRFLVAQAGIMFAVSLVTIQTGIFNSFARSTTDLIEDSPADIWVVHKTIINLDQQLPMPYYYLTKSQRLSGIKRAEALILDTAVWLDKNDKITLVRLISFDPQGQLFKPENITQGDVDDLNQPYAVMVDELNLKTLNVQKMQERAEINTLPVQIVGMTRGNTSITANTFVFTSLSNANTYLNSGFQSSLNCKLSSDSGEIECSNIRIKTPENQLPPKPAALDAADSITFILVSVDDNADLEKVKAELEANLPDTRAFTKEEIANLNRTFWLQRTGIGFILGLGATVGIIVGIAIVGQILYASVSSHIKEFGTLKAMGASNKYIYGIIIEQALLMAILGYFPSLALCLGVSTWAAATQGILILITPTTAILVFGVTVVMCVGSAFFAIQRVTKVDPAIVFKA
ncbi:MAG: FtsX-like permease family protein [Oscillatoria sp. PMC 1051.18]|nr:FtsX-like permease family protein [Oscillatoria sp. PMC 1050.18]MEC5030457.1 FtsX-like permease family protein [Oscillatoria sp. PMC 1051.18]